MRVDTIWSRWLREKAAAREEESPRAIAPHIALGTDSARSIADEIERLRAEIKDRDDAYRSVMEDEVARIREEHFVLIEANAQVANLFCCHEELLAAAKEVSARYLEEFPLLDAAIAACDEERQGARATGSPQAKERHNGTEAK